MDYKTLSCEDLSYSQVPSKHLKKKIGRERKVCLFYDHFHPTADLKHGFVLLFSDIS